MYLVLFDMDGTLIDSQAVLVSSMTNAFEAVGLNAPNRATVLSIIGLSLPQAMWRLAPDVDADVQEKLIAAFQQSAMKFRHQKHLTPLYAGAVECLKALQSMDNIILGIATGKARRGVDAVFAEYNLAQYFETVQTADCHPSKPHPSMVEAALLETGVDTGVMIGDTTYDVEMGRAGGIDTIGVSWGYHSPANLAPFSDYLVDHFEHIIPTIHKLRSK